jgi:23S rRNA (guanosine2251-2'-O)-methyltransferase
MIEARAATSTSPEAPYRLTRPTEMSTLRPPRRDRTIFRRRRSEIFQPADVQSDAPSSRPARGGSSAKPAALRPANPERWLYGRHAVTAALANPERRWSRLVVLAGQEEEATALVASAQAAQLGDGAAIRVLDRDGLEAILPGAVHQGIALEVEPLAERNLEEVVGHAALAAGRSVVIVLDQISDPQNVGAVMRSAAAFGARAVIVPGHGAPPMTGVLAKAASGALESVPLVRVVNLARALDRLKEAGFWVCGLDETGQDLLAGLDLGERIVIVLGSEGSGMRRLVRERCDFLARLPTRAAQPTLNVSNAAAVALYELIRGAETA